MSDHDPLNPEPDPQAAAPVTGDPATLPEPGDDPAAMSDDAEIDALLAQAESLANEATAPTAGIEGQASDAVAGALPLPDFGADFDRSEPVQPIDMLRDVGLHVKIELGRCRMLVEDVLRLAEGSIVELDKLAGDPVDIYANDRLVARGEVLVLNDNFCVRVNEIFADVSQGLQRG